MKRLIRLPILAVAMAFAVPAAAQPDGEITYVIKKGDTLYDLARKYLSDHRSMSEIRTANGIKAPRRLQIGQTLMLPRAALRYEPVGLEVGSFTGRVTVDGPSGRTNAAQGLGLSEGAVVATGPNSFASISGDDNTVITMPSNSRVK
ncbi:MAG: LysM peptidoglycan-binding domain-containing protein, partial [Pseudomonadota bacterium]